MTRMVEGRIPAVRPVRVSHPRVQPNWTPTLPTPCSGASDDFTVADLLAFALDGG